MKKTLLILGVVWTFSSIFTFGQSNEKFGILIEAGVLWQNRNDVRVPNESGTLFSLKDAVGAGPYGVFRAEADFNINDRHGFRFVFAPLRINEPAILPTEVSFAGELFAPDIRTAATYKFSSYRVTYRYRFYNGSTWSWRVGATAFIRDAKISLRQNDLYAEDTDVGFVPLVYLQGIARLDENWKFILDFDGLAASQGRAFDISAKLGYSVSDQMALEFGYRTIEGGADVEQVYNFAWLNSLVGSVRFRF